MTPQEYSDLLQTLAQDKRLAGANIKAQRGSQNDLAAILHLKGGITVTFNTAEEFTRWYAERTKARG
jgi:hypothetical protein